MLLRAGLQTLGLCPLSPTEQTSHLNHTVSLPLTPQGSGSSSSAELVRGLFSVSSGGPHILLWVLTETCLGLLGCLPGATLEARDGV